MPAYRVFFSMSTGLSKVVRVPAGTLAEIFAHIEGVEQKLGLKCERYLDNPVHWATTDFADISDDVLCDTADEHNGWIVDLWNDFCKWAQEPIEGGEEITPEQSVGFWYGLEPITVPAERWTATYYRSRMEHLYEVMRGVESEGVSFEAGPLRPQQASAVIVLFAEFLDAHDLRLEVRRGYDCLESSDDRADC